MILFKSEKLGEGYEDMRYLSLEISLATDPTKTNWYQVIDSRKSYRNNDGWIRVIKRDGERINYANNKKMTHFDIDIVNYINDTYPLPQ
jgi:hypothetical protein